MADRCQPFPIPVPDKPLFDTRKVAIVSNGRYVELYSVAASFVSECRSCRCASSCALFSVCMRLPVTHALYTLLIPTIHAQIPMAKEEGAKTVVVGGKNGVQQEYCGTVGGQSVDFSTIDTEIKVLHAFFQRHDITSADTYYFSG